MCGLFGFASSKPLKNIQQVMMQLALYNEERGKASWGITDGKEVWKDVGPIGRNLYRLPLRDSGIYVGHTRAATVGDTKKGNAHPFSFNSEANDIQVIGSHNGTIQNWDALNKKYGVKLEVDSMHIFRHLAINLPMEEISGWGTITFVRNGKLCFARFHGGELSIAQIRKNKGIVWSSEEYALKKALEAANLDHYFYKVNEDFIYY